MFLHEYSADTRSNTGTSSVFTGSVWNFAELQVHIHLISDEGRVIETNIDPWFDNIFINCLYIHKEKS
jgi:hypothetical protein